MAIVLYSFLLLFRPVHAEPTRPLVIFDLDHTLVDTNLRTIAILRDIGVDLGIDELLSVTPAQVERLRRHELDALGLRDPGAAQRIFGRGADQLRHGSEFGRRFYHDASYLKYDGVIPGAPEFVARLAREIGAEIVYLTGRFDEEFREATRAQLEHWGFPREGTTLILKPKMFGGATDSFKLVEFAKLEADGAIVAVFDDARRNVNAFARYLTPDVPVVRLTRDINDRRDLDPRIEQITNYVYNTRRENKDDERLETNAAQINVIIARARACASHLSSPR